MSAKKDWERFAAFAQTGDVEQIHVMMQAMTAEQVKECMEHGARLMHQQLSGKNPANKPEVIFPADPGLPRFA